MFMGLNFETFQIWKYLPEDSVNVKCANYGIVFLSFLKKNYFHVMSYKFGKRLKYLMSFKYFLENETSYTTVHIKITWYTNTWFIHRNWMKHEFETPTIQTFLTNSRYVLYIYSHLPWEQRVLLEVTQVQRDGATGGGVPRPLQDHRLGVHLAQTVTANPSHQCHLFLGKQRYLV